MESWTGPGNSRLAVHSMWPFLGLGATPSHRRVPHWNSETSLVIPENTGHVRKNRVAAWRGWYLTHRTRWYHRWSTRNFTQHWSNIQSMEENLLHRGDLARLPVLERWCLTGRTFLCYCGQFQCIIIQAGVARTSSCARNIICKSWSIGEADPGLILGWKQTG